jgi:transposase
VQLAPERFARWIAPHRASEPYHWVGRLPNAGASAAVVMATPETVIEFRRRRGVQLLEEGVPATLIARVLGVTTSSLYHWRKLAHSPEGLSFTPGGGRPRRLTDGQVDTLRRLLLRGATAYGWPNDLWTSKRVAEVVRRHFHVPFTPQTAWRTLTRYMGWTPQRPIQQLRERDEEEIASWRAQEYPEILKRACKRRASLIFIDESGFLLAPAVRRTFAPRGQPPVIKSGNPHGRISAIGALLMSPTRRHFALKFHLLEDNANFRGESVRAFVSGVCQRRRGPITILWDAIPIHRARPVAEYLARNRRIVVERFP